MSRDGPPHRGVGQGFGPPLSRGCGQRVRCAKPREGEYDFMNQLNYASRLLSSRSQESITAFLEKWAWYPCTEATSRGARLDDCCRPRAQARWVRCAKPESRQGNPGIKSRQEGSKLFIPMGDHRGSRKMGLVDFMAMFEHGSFFRIIL